jgi:hypothetical protein
MEEFKGTGVQAVLSPDDVKKLVALLDNSWISRESVNDESTYLGLIAFRDQLLFDAAKSIHVDANDPKQMGVLYRQVEQMFAPPTKKTAVGVVD